MKTTRTQRGFQRIDFKDAYGEPCSLQVSSSASMQAVWLGQEHETIHQVTGEKCGARMHLERRTVKSLIRHLQNWLDTGDFSKKAKL